MNPFVSLDEPVDNADFENSEQRLAVASGDRLLYFGLTNVSTRDQQE